MRNLISVFLLLSLFLFSGCIKFYTYKKYPIKVIDPELNQPVEGASVLSSFIPAFGGRWGNFEPKNRPKDVMTSTDVNGFAELSKVKNSGRYRFYGFIEADGYIPISLDDIRKVGSKGELIVPLYRKPKPRVEVIVPNDYLGPVGIALTQTNDWVPEKPGQRLFSYRMNQNGYLPIQISPVFPLRQLTNEIIAHRNVSSEFYNSRFIVKRENGSQIARVGRNYKNIISAGREYEIEPGSIAFRWVWDERARILFVIGTAQDRQTLHDKVMSGGTGHIDSKTFSSYFSE